MNKNILNKINDITLALNRAKVEKATGANAQDYKYGIAEKVTRHENGTATVIYNDIEYGPAVETFGALDGSENKMTVLINAKQNPTDPNNWTKIEYKIN